MFLGSGYDRGTWVLIGLRTYLNLGLGIILQILLVLEPWL